MTTPIFLTSSTQQDTISTVFQCVCRCHIAQSVCSQFLLNSAYFWPFRTYYSVFFRYQTYRGGREEVFLYLYVRKWKIEIFETMFACANLLLCQPTLCNLWGTSCLQLPIFGLHLPSLLLLQVLHSGCMAHHFAVHLQIPWHIPMWGSLSSCFETHSPGLLWRIWTCGQTEQVQHE